MSVEEFVENYYVERQNTHSLKWDLLEERFGNADLLPLWVADMDFKVSPAITEALVERVQHGVYGYTFAGPSYYEAVGQWMSQNFNFPVDREWVRFSGGVVQAIYHLINAYTEKDDAVIIQTPVYYPFANAVRDTGRKLVSVDLVNNNGYFTIDYDAFEQAIVDNDVKLYIHCSPHNPVGRVWTEDEAVRLLDICQKHGVQVISDEIHQDFVYGNNVQIPSAVLNNGAYRSSVVTVSSASKTFNIAGLTHCNIIITDDALRQQYDAYAQTIVQTEANVMGLFATEAAYTGGHPWLDGLKEVVYHNYELVVDAFKALPDVVVSPLEGTYLVFIDLNKELDASDIKAFIQDKCGLAVDYGEWFGDNYTGFIRLNLATKPELVETALARIVENLG